MNANHNAPLYLLAILAAGVSGLVVPSVLLWGCWYMLRQGQWVFAILALVAVVGYVETLFVAIRGAQTRHWRIEP